MKIKKFLAMVSLSAFVLTNVIPIGVLAGGENQKRRLKSVAYSSSDFKGYNLNINRMQNPPRHHF